MKTHNAPHQPRASARRLDALIERWDRERRLLAMLAAETPQFFNPLDVFEAKAIRDRILRSNAQVYAAERAMVAWNLGVGQEGG